MFTIYYLLTRIESNNQCYNRGGARVGHKDIAKRVIELYPNGFDYKKYPNINKKIVAWKKLDEFDVKTNIF